MIRCWTPLPFFPAPQPHTLNLPGELSRTTATQPVVINVLFSSSTRTILFTTTTATKPAFSKVSSSLHSVSRGLGRVHLRPLPSSKVGGYSVSVAGFGGSSSLCQSKRGIRSGVVVMAGSGSPVQKSEEEWRAVLSPEQFRILRQKGTDEFIHGEAMETIKASLLQPGKLSKLS